MCVQQYNSSIQQYSRKNAKKQRQEDLNSFMYSRIRKQKSRDRGIWTDILLVVQNRALYRWAKMKRSDYLPCPVWQLWKIVARRVWLRRPLFRQGSRGLLCGWDLVRSRGLGGSGGARESQLFLGYFITGMFSKNHLVIIYAFLGMLYQIYCHRRAKWRC